MNQSKQIQSQQSNSIKDTVTLNKELKQQFKSNDIRTNYGKVWLVGFGPGDPELLTIKGLKLLQTADIIFYDDLLNKEYVAEFKAEKVYVGKRKDKHSFEQNEINKLMVQAAISGKKVVRLKGGDPMIFAHGGEEIEYLRQNQIEVSIVPGITTALAAAAYTGIPLTHRGLASSVTFLSGHSIKKMEIPKSGTLVLYMGGSNLQTIASEVIRKGWNSNTPVLLAYNVSNPGQEEYYTTLEQIINEPKIYKTPVIIIMGDVVRLKTQTYETIEKGILNDSESTTAINPMFKEQKPSINSLIPSGIENFKPQKSMHPVSKHKFVIEKIES